MAITNGYCTLDELKDRLDIDDWQDDTIAEAIITAVSRAIESIKGEVKFYASTQTRTYTPHEWDLLFLDEDLISITTLKTDNDADGTYENTWDSTGYVLKPSNAGDDTKPYRWLEYNHRNNNSNSFTFPVGVQDGVEIVGSWGYTNSTVTAGVVDSPPAAIKQACLLMSERVFKRKDMPFGTAAGGAIGAQSVQRAILEDPEIMMLLDSVRSRRVNVDATWNA